MDFNGKTFITLDSQCNKILTQKDRDDFTISQEAERALIRKFDLQILSLLAVMYLFNSLDKSNLGNAKTAGLEKGLIMERTNDYNILLSIFFSSPRYSQLHFWGFLGRCTVRAGFSHA